MPPKKRKAAEGNGVSHQYMWLLMYKYGHSSELDEAYAVYSSKEKAIAGLDDFMGRHCSILGDDWKNGLKGFGKEDEDDYMAFEFFGDSVGDEGGVLLENDTEAGGDPCSVHLKRLKVNDPGSTRTETKVATAGDFFGCSF
jgi:hypothetical protein